MRFIPAQTMYWPTLDQYACGFMFHVSTLPPPVAHIFEVFHGPIEECGICNYPHQHIHPDIDSFTQTVNIATGNVIWTAPFGSEPGRPHPPRHSHSWQARSRN